MRGFHRRLARALAIATGAMAAAAGAQTVESLEVPAEPLVLEAQGSFVIGGEMVERAPAQLSSTFGRPPASGGHIAVNQMYVRYMIPAQGAGVPVVMLHGASLSGKTYETTPDGRMGWDEYFVRRGHPAYVPDQVSRGRSAVDIAVYNDVRSGLRPPADLPNAFRGSIESSWRIMRFGPEYGTPFADTRFPVAAAEELIKQAVPDFNPGLPSPNPTFGALAELARRIGGAVLMGHSESGAFPLEAALIDRTGISGLVLLEPGRCNTRPFPDEQVATLATLPILILFADHLDTDTGIAGFSWQDSLRDCQAFAARIVAAGGDVTVLHLPARGIRGNSHMMMMDTNNLEVADLILEWIAGRARPRPS